MAEMPFKVTTDVEHLPVTGSDSCIMAIPDEVYVQLDDGPAVDVRALAYVLRTISAESAAHIGETLHHADWQITGDPDVVEKIGMTHGCASCRASVDQALAHLREHGGELLVAMLYWAGG